MQQRFSTRGPFPTRDASDLIINAAWGFKFIAWSYGSFWALSTYETSQQCLWEVLNDTSGLTRCSGCEWNASAQTDAPHQKLQACPEDSSSSNPPSIRHWTCSHRSCSGACCCFPAASPSQFGWTATKPGLNPFSRSPQPLHTLQCCLPKDVPMHYLFCCLLLHLCMEVVGSIICLHNRGREEGRLAVMQRSSKHFITTKPLAVSCHSFTSSMAGANKTLNIRDFIVETQLLKKKSVVNIPFVPQISPTISW